MPYVVVTLLGKLAGALLPPSKIVRNREVSIRESAVATSEVWVAPVFAAC